MKYILLTILALLIASNAVAEIHATTDDGQRVQLNNDGTWSFYTAPPRATKEYVYMDSLVKIEVKDVKTLGFIGTDIILGTELTFFVTNLSKTKVISPKTHVTYGFEDGSDIGGRMPRGFMLSDNYGNDLKVGSLHPEYIGYKEKGLRPGETKTFKLTANDYPLETISHLQLSIDKGVFENDKLITLTIPKQMVRNTLHNKSMH